jgi:phage terminase large subunit
MEKQSKFNFQLVTTMKKVFAMRKRIRAVAGGTSASKTISILVWIIDYSQQNHGSSKLTHVVSESFPHLEMGAMLDFQNIMKDRGYWDENRWHGTQHQYTFETGNQVRFMSVDTYGKAHGPRRDILYVNECNNLAYKIVDQLITRTRDIVWLDWNPSEEFWFYTEMLPHRDDLEFITVTYKDNEALDENTVYEIESHKHNKNWWNVYGLGLLGAIENRIYTNWTMIDDIPDDARLVRRWLDFGYSNDPTAMGNVYKWKDGYVLDEFAYRKGLLNSDIATLIKNQGDDNIMVIADSSEPKSIDEIALYGVNIHPAVKGRGSINTGIQFVQQQNIYVTKRSVNIWKEYKNYLWQCDKNDNIINEPEGGFDHHCDGIRYSLNSILEQPKYERATTISQSIYANG